MSGRHGRRDLSIHALLWIPVVIAVLGSCFDEPESSFTPTVRPTISCLETPTNTHIAGGHTVHGKAASGFFLYMYPTGEPRQIKAQSAEKFLLFMVPLPDDLSAHVALIGRHLQSGRLSTFNLQRHASEFGTEWGANFVFPEAGCWDLEIASEPGRGKVTIRVD